jgi:hypothetical protein
LIERLQISSALCLQPLTLEQVYEVLDSGGTPLVGLKTLLKNDTELEQFARTPLILNFMSVAYQGWSVEQLLTQLRSSTDRHQHLFDTYIDRRLARGAASEYSKDLVLRWLSWLADKMVREKQTIFLIEKMQPTWLQTINEERAYRIKAFIFSGLIVGLSVGLSVGVISGRIFSLSYGLGLDFIGLFSGLIAGLLGGLIGGSITGLQKKISPFERLSWSRQRVKSRWVHELFFGTCLGILFRLLVELVGAGVSFGEFDWQMSGLTGALIFGLSSGLGSSEIEQRIIPNQGIRSSGRNCIISLIGGLLVGLFVGLFAGLKFRLASSVIYLTSHWLIIGLYIGLITGLIIGLVAGMKFGGVACMQHFTLRQILYQKSRIPWNYVKFLDFASDRLLMKKVGGGYVFFHRMLLEHFARMNPN